MDIEQIRAIALQNGWTEIQHNVQSKVIGFARGNERVNVYTTGTVGTCIDHPRKAKTQLFRRNQTHSSLGDIFVNPRVHTGEQE